MRRISWLRNFIGGRTTYERLATEIAAEYAALSRQAEKETA
jgi:hypothetical protein